MNQNLSFGGARILTGKDAEAADLGPLAQLSGTWISAPNPPGGIAQGWNVISVPDPNDFVFEVIPYTEILSFKPVVIQATNKGPADKTKGKEKRIDQQITGLMYNQEIKSACPTDKPCSNDFPAGQIIHAETGLLLNFKFEADSLNPSDGFDIARLSTIPHGNSVLALGHGSKQVATKSEPIGNSFFPSLRPDHPTNQIAPAAPTNLDGSAASGQGILFGYGENITDPGQAQFNGIFDQAYPNSFLQKALGISGKLGSPVITEMTTLKMSTNNANAGGGILNIPFIQSNARATTMDAIFWIETIRTDDGKSHLQLQYSQTINLVFPPGGSVTPIVWPHITVNTLVKKDGKSA